MMQLTEKRTKMPGEALSQIEAQLPAWLTRRFKVKTMPAAGRMFIETPMMRWTGRLFVEPWTDDHVRLVFEKGGDLPATVSAENREAIADVVRKMHLVKDAAKAVADVIRLLGGVGESMDALLARIEEAYGEGE